MTDPDRVFLQTLYEMKKATKRMAGYRLTANRAASCVKCKFNLGDERRCHVVEGRINNERGISKFFSPKGDGMLPGDLVWKYVNQSSGLKKLPQKRGHVIREGAKGYQCKDCKYYLYSRKCLLIRGTFRPEMSCGYIVKTGHGIDM